MSTVKRVCIYMYIHEPCVQQGRPGGVAIYNVYVHVDIQCKLRYVAVVRNYTTIILMKNQCMITHIYMYI